MATITPFANLYDRARRAIGMHEPAGVESRRITVETGDESIAIRYLTAGEGDCVMLLHGIGLDAAHVSWKHALPHLAANHRVIAPDFPGHGESDGADDYTMAFYHAVLDGLFDALAIERASLVGISMGGAVALGHALDHQQRIERLVLVDGYGLGHDAPWRPGGAALLNTPGFGGWLGAGLANPALVASSLVGLTVAPSTEFISDVQRAVGPAAARALAAWQRDEFRACGLRTCYLDRLHELAMPTLLVHGREDPIFPIAWSERAAERIPDGEFVAFERCGHWPPREHPERFNRLVGDFL
jgi:pimeloyl-ACP methyl ester carboxylesterase